MQANEQKKQYVAPQVAELGSVSGITLGFLLNNGGGCSGQVEYTKHAL